MTTDILQIVGGLILLFVGGEALVRGSVAIAERFGISKLLIGLTIVGFGTSAPELLVSVDAALSGAPEIAIGNVVGSNVANVLLILGIAAIVVPIVGWRRTAVRDAMVAALVALAMYGLVHGETIGRTEGIVLLTVLGVYLFASYWLERRDNGGTTFVEETEEFEDLRLPNPWLSAALVVIGLGALVLGARLLVQGAVSVAVALGVSDAVIGLSIVAVGTSFPELATAVVAAYRRHLDVVLGNVIGSNIFNVLAILGLTAVIQPIAVADRFAEFDVLVVLGVSAGLVLMLFIGRPIGRLIGLGMVLLYAAYLAALYAI